MLNSSEKQFHEFRNYESMRFFVELNLFIHSYDTTIYIMIESTLINKIIKSVN